MGAKRIMVNFCLLFLYPSNPNRPILLGTFFYHIKENYISICRIDMQISFLASSSGFSFHVAI